MKEQSNHQYKEATADFLAAEDIRLQEQKQILKLSKKLKLKPCPFCGGKAGIISNDCLPLTRPARYQVGCVMSKGWCVVHPVATYGDGCFVEEIPELADVWNRRAEKALVAQDKAKNIVKKLLAYINGTEVQP